MLSANHYRDLLKEECTTIAGLCDKWQNILNHSHSVIPDEAHGKIQIALGQAQLLMEKKFKQFRGLIDNCEQGGSTMEVTVDDLQGFWELVFIQVRDIHNKFQEVEKLRDNNWEPPTIYNQRQPLAHLNKATVNNVPRRKSSVANKDFTIQAKERLAQAKALVRKRMEEQSYQ